MIPLGRRTYRVFNDGRRHEFEMKRDPNLRISVKSNDFHIVKIMFSNGIDVPPPECLLFPISMSPVRSANFAQARRHAQVCSPCYVTSRAIPQFVTSFGNSISRIYEIVI
jgi:hypothetical protein